VVGHSGNSIPEKPVSSIGKGTDVSGVWSGRSPRLTRCRVGSPHPTPETSVPNYSDRHYISPQRFDPTTSDLERESRARQDARDAEMEKRRWNLIMGYKNS